jgi:hypothetical protein
MPKTYWKKELQMQSYVGPSPAAFQSLTSFILTSFALDPTISSSKTKQLKVELKKNSMDLSYTFSLRCVNDPMCFADQSTEYFDA